MPFAIETSGLQMVVASAPVAQPALQLQKLLIGQAGQHQSPFAANDFQPSAPGQITLGWSPPASGPVPDNYVIWRAQTAFGSNVLSSYQVVGSVSAAQAIANYATYQQNSVGANGQGGFGLPPAAGNAAGPYPYVDWVSLAFTDKTAATASGYPITGGPQFYPAIGYNYKVQSFFQGSPSLLSASDMGSFMVNGRWPFCGGVFNGTLTQLVTAPAITPLGFTNCSRWTTQAPSDIINAFCDFGCPQWSLPIGGWQNVYINIWPTQNVSLSCEPERRPDINFQNPQGTTSEFFLENFAPGGVLLANRWNQVIVPISIFMVDLTSGVNITELSFYKDTKQIQTGGAGQNIYLEKYFQ